MNDSAQAVNPSRRHLLRGAGVAGLAATAVAAEQIIKPAAAQAANGDSLILGQDNTETSATTLENTANNANGLQVTSSAPGNSALVGINNTTTTGQYGAGVYGYSSADGIGVYGYSVSNWGVAAASYDATALQAQSINAIGIVGVSNTVTAIYGQSGGTDGYKETKDAIRGFTDSSSGSGLRGENVGGGVGVTGVASNGTKAGGGIGVLANAGGDGTALKVVGRAAFSQSGDAEIKAGQTSVTVKVPDGLASTSLVLALLQTPNPGVFVTSAVPDASKGEVTIHLNKAPAGGKAGTLKSAGVAKVAWFVVN
jgi:hypothetical protein